MRKNCLDESLIIYCYKKKGIIIILTKLQLVSLDLILSQLEYSSDVLQGYKAGIYFFIDGFLQIISEFQSRLDICNRILLNGEWIGTR